MKIFSWMRSKHINATNQDNPQPKSYHDHMLHQSCKQEFSDWPNGLLAIGTFGNNNLKHEEEDDQDKTTTTTTTTSRAQDLEQVDRELRLLLNNNHSISVDSSFSGENENNIDNENLWVDQLLDRLRSGSSGGADLKRNSSSVVERGRKRGGIGKKSLSFLMKKILLCGGGFVAPPPIIRDPLPDPKLDHSTMEKILRAMLHNKIYPQRPTPKKYLEMGERGSEDEHDEEACNHTSKWDKTDSEYIVLEI